MQGIAVNLNEIKEHANRLNQSNSSLLSELNEFAEVMKFLVDHWESPSANTLYSEFQKLRPTFDKYSEYIDAYYKFLNQTVDTYEALDNALESGIEIA